MRIQFYIIKEVTFFHITNGVMAHGFGGFEIETLTSDSWLCGTAVVFPFFLIRGDQTQILTFLSIQEIFTPLYFKSENYLHIIIFIIKKKI